jgi:hypothetical protein
MISATNNMVANDSGICVTMKAKANKSLENNAQVQGTPHYIFNPHVIIGMELSFVPEVDFVFANCEQSQGFRVVTIINEIDDAIETKIYEREEAIMDAIPSSDFDFRILARHNRDLSGVMTDGGKLVFQRKK